MLDAGLTLGDRYTLVTLIARGGMGEVWSADDTVLDRRVAVKVLLPNRASDPGFAARFRAEARAMAALSDPGIVDVYDYGQADGIAYLVMRFVAGESSHALVSREGALAPERAMGLLAQAAAAIHSAHSQGIIHRDVKPGNLLLRPDGRLVLTDFGIARIMAGDRITAVDEIVGTASYLAPEQVTGEAVSPATDVYALGVVAYELLTQRKPFEGESPLSVALQHVNDAPRPLPSEIPAPVRDVVMRALAKDPADRWPSAAAMAQAATDAIGTPAAPPARRRWLVAAGLALVAAIGLIYAVSRSPANDPGATSLDPSAGPSIAAPAASTSATPGSVLSGSASPARRKSPSPSPVASRPASSAVGSAKPSASPASTTRTVPAMFGWRESEAVSELKRLDLVAHIVHRSTLDKCYVIEQTPTGGSTVQAGSTVDIVVATATGQCDVI